MNYTKKFKPDIMLPFMDLTVEAEALGLEIDFSENDNPAVKKHPVKNVNDLKCIAENWDGIAGRMHVFIDLINQMTNKLPGTVEVYGYVIGPFTLVGELMGVTPATMATISNPELIEKLLDFSIKVISKYANKQFEAGANAVVVLEPTAMLLSPESYKVNSQKPFKKILKKVNNNPLILHICGDTSYLIEEMCNTGAVGLSLDTPVNFGKLANEVPEDIKLIGNIDPVEIFLNGNPEEVKEATINLVKEMKNYDNFILSTGCDLPLETPFANVEAFMDIGRKWKNNKL